MRRRILLPLLTATVLLLSLTVTAASTGDRDTETARYNVVAERLIDGEVAGIGHVVTGIVFFKLKTGDRVIQVELGPREFVAKSGFNLKIGEMVAVLGAPPTSGRRGVILAREVRTMSALFVVRDRNGRPMWDPDRPVEMDPESSESNLCKMLVNQNASSLWERDE
jgi:hypothetical protein